MPATHPYALWKREKLLVNEKITAPVEQMSPSIILLQKKTKLNFEKRLG